MKSLFTINILLFLSSCYFVNAQNTPQQTATIKTEINTLMNNWHKAASEANFDNYFDAMDNTAVFVGTDASEVWSKNEFQNFSKPYFDKGKAWSFSTIKRNIYTHSSNKIAWFNEILDTWMGICRGSGVVEKINNKWIIKHYVLSVTVPNEDIKPVIKIKQKRDSIFLNKLRD